MTRIPTAPFILFLVILSISPLRGAEILWAQYTQDRDMMRLMVHLDALPSEPEAADVKLKLKASDDTWMVAGVQPMYTLTSTALFVLNNWPRHQAVRYQVSCGDSKLEGVFRAEPQPDEKVKMVGLSCLAEHRWPWKEAIDSIASYDPDILFFSGDQVYSYFGFSSPEQRPQNSADMYVAMDRYLDQYRRFGLAFRDLLKDRPSIFITDDRDLNSRGLWGAGGLRRKSDKNTLGYPSHLNWVNAVEFLQTGTLPAPHDKGPHGDGVLAYYTQLQYGGVDFAILEDRKFKSSPEEALLLPNVQEKLGPESVDMSRYGLVKNSDFDCDLLDGDGLQLLGPEQEDFLEKWCRQLERSDRIGAILTQSPWVQMAMCTSKFPDLHSNGWPQAGRRRAVAAIKEAPVLLIHGDSHLGAIMRYSSESKWGQGPLAYSLPAFSEYVSRSWQPSKAGFQKTEGAPDYTGGFFDCFGNPLTVNCVANKQNGFGVITFDPAEKSAIIELRPLDENCRPLEKPVVGWPRVEKL